MVRWHGELRAKEIPYSGMFYAVYNLAQLSLLNLDLQDFEIV